MDKRYNLKLDLQFRCNNSKMIFDEFDENTSDFFMQITRQGEKIDISNSIPTLLVLKPGGVAASQILEVKNNIIYGNLKNSLKNEVGTYIAKLMLVEGDKKIFISNISYEVTENALLGKIDNDIAEDERYSILLQLLERLSNIELQEQTRVDNENSRIEAENLRQEAIEKIKNDIDFLVNETNKKVDNNLNSNTSKIDNLIINTKEELNKYKENKDKFINEDLEEFKENTNKSIQDYKAFKDVEINNSLNTYKTNVTNDINSFKNTVNSKIDKYKNDKDKAINEYIEGKSLELDNYVEAKNNEIDEYKTSKNNELDLYISKKNTLIDSKISEVDVVKEQLQNSVNNKLIEIDNAEQIRQQEHEERQQFLNGFEGKLNTVVDDVADIKDDVVSVREANKRQDVFLQGLYNENLDGRVTIKEEGSVISLTNSDNGLVDIIGLEGNTLVNYVTDGAKELVLNGDIDVAGTSVTLTECVDNGKVDVMCEGNTLVNLCSKETENTHLDSSNYKDYTVQSNVSHDSPNIIFALNRNIVSNDVYTLKISTQAPNECYQVSVRLRDIGANTNYDIKTYDITSNKSIDDIISFSPNSSFTPKNDCGLQIIYRFDSVENAQGKTVIIEPPMIFEGDLTQTPGLIPTEYFEGMKSVAEREDNKIEILSNNYNLFEKDKYLPIGISNSNGKMIVSSKYRSYWIECEPNTTYFIESDKSGNRFGVACSAFNGDDETEFFVSKWEISTTTDTTERVISTIFTTDSDARYLFVYVANNAVFPTPKITIAKSNVAKPYIEPKLNKKEITLSEPLRALPNGVKDKVVKVGGKWYVERNCGEVVLDGSNMNNIITSPPPIDTTLIRFEYASSSIKNGYNNAICDMLPQNDKQHFADVNYESIDVHPNINMIVIWLNKDKLQSEDLSGFKTWLINNPLKIVYVLANPIYEELPIDPTLNTYNDITHISNNSTIPCDMTVKNTGYNAIIKPSTQYTVAFDTDKSGTVGINLGGSKVTTTNNVATVTTPSTLTDDSLRLTGKGIKASKVRLLEGDKTNWIPGYFEGMKSSFEDKLQDDGTYKMEIVSNNKNLFKQELYPRKQFSVTATIVDKNTINIKNTAEVSRAYQFFTFDAEPNTTYTFSMDEPIVNKGTYRVMLREVISGDLYNDNYIVSPTANLNFTFTTPSSIKDDVKVGICLWCYTDGVAGLGDVTFKNIQIEKGNKKSSYTEQEHNKIQFSSIEPLRGVGDVKDRFVFKNGKLMIERNYGEVVLNGSEKWISHGNYVPFMVTNLELKPNGNISRTDKGLCDKLPLRFITSNDDNDNAKGVYLVGSGSYSQVRIRITDKDTTTSVKQYLQDNPTTIVYQLAEPLYEEIPFELQKIILEGYKNGTLFFDTNIPPTVEASYTANIPLVSKVNKVNEVTETNTEDIAITQMAVDFLLMSSLGEEMLNFKVRSGYNMASYFASRIIKGALKYEDVINKYPQYKKDIDLILISEGHSDLIIEL